MSSSARLSSPRSTEGRRSLSSISQLSHSTANIDHSKAAVVIELGTKLTKIGFAGEMIPRHIVRTEYYDDEMKLKRGFLSSTGIQGNTKNLFHFLKHLYFDCLLCLPRERRVVIVENVLCSTKMREQLCEVLLEKLDAPSIFFVPGHLCATFPFNTEKALVVDVGHRESVCLPVSEGVTLLNNIEVSQVAGSSLEDRALELIKEFAEVKLPESTRTVKDEDIEKIVGSHLVEDFIVKYCFCTSMKRGRALVSDIKTPLQPAVNPVSMSFGENMLIIPGFVRESVCEVLFENSSADKPSIAETIHNVVSKLPLDLRRPMFKSLLFKGGVTLIPGFLSRIQEELQDLGRLRNLKTAQEIKTYRFQDQQIELFTSWVGASLFGVLNDAIGARSVSRTSWTETRKIPDWTDYVQYNIPCGRVDLGA